MNSLFGSTVFALLMATAYLGLHKGNQYAENIFWFGFGFSFLLAIINCLFIHTQACKRELAKSTRRPFKFQSHVSHTMNLTLSLTLAAFGYPIWALFHFCIKGISLLMFFELIKELELANEQS